MCCAAIKSVFRLDSSHFTAQADVFVHVVDHSDLPFKCLFIFIVSFCILSFDLEEKEHK